MPSICPALALALGLLGSFTAAPRSRPLLEAIEVEPGPHGCLDREALARQVAIWLGTDVLDERVTIEARADPRRRDLVHFRVSSDHAVLVDRPFEPVPVACDATHAALGLAVAITLDATVLAPFVDVTETSPLDAVAAAPEPTTVSPPATPPRRARAAASLQAVAVGGLFPAAGFGGRLLGQVTPVPAVALRLGVGATRGLAAPLGDGDAHMTVFAAQLDLCAGGTAGAAVLRGCLGVEAGPALARGRGHARDLRTFAPWTALRAGLSTTVPARAGVAFALDLDVVVPVVRPRFVVTDAESGATIDALAPAPVGAAIALGPVFHWP